MSDAVQTVFPLETERAIMLWNSVYVPLTYKYDLSLMMDDILELVECILTVPAGECSIDWPSNTFAGTWRARWQDDSITIESNWRSVLGNTEAMLAETALLVVPTGGFVAEWKRPLEIINSALQAAGYSAKRIPAIRRLQAIVEKIPRYGALYA